VQQLEGVRGIQAQVLIDGQSVTVLVAHPNRPRLPREPLGSSFPLNQLRLPDYSSASRDQQIARLLDIIPTIEGPLLLAGDLNLADREPGYAALDALLHDAYAETNIGLGHTYPRRLTREIHTWLPPLRIDYIWTRSDLLPLSAHVNCDATGSDHCMLVADLVLLESQR
jgi:endonuclease/exonuclease/phosphatase family metal-dependent hydrolase